MLGLGNLLLGDEGFGVHAAARLRARFRLPPDVEVVDGGTLGLGLLAALEDADRILVLDALDAGQPPGTVVRLSWDDLPRVVRTKVSPHQVTVQEVLALREFRHGRPAAFEAVGVQPASLEPGCDLSSEVEAAMGEALATAVAVLRGWGHSVEVAGAAPGAAALPLLPAKAVPSGGS